MSSALIKLYEINSQCADYRTTFPFSIIVRYPWYVRMYCSLFVGVNLSHSHIEVISSTYSVGPSRTDIFPKNQNRRKTRCRSHNSSLYYSLSSRASSYLIAVARALLASNKPAGIEEQARTTNNSHNYNYNF